MSVTLDLQIVSDDEEEPPSASDIQGWVEAACAGAARMMDAELTVRITDEAESAELNFHYRHKNGPTNVLSFPFEAPPGLTDLPLLGDLVICAPIVRREAETQNKSPRAHWAHMVVHGTLHLLGHDHTEPAGAEQMEALEIAILSRLGLADPYHDDETS